MAAGLDRVAEVAGQAAQDPAGLPDDLVDAMRADRPAAPVARRPAPGRGLSPPAPPHRGDQVDLAALVANGGQRQVVNRTRLVELAGSGRALWVHAHRPRQGWLVMVAPARPTTSSDDPASPRTAPTTDLN